MPLLGNRLANALLSVWLLADAARYALYLRGGDGVDVDAVLMVLILAGQALVVMRRAPPRVEDRSALTLLVIGGLFVVSALYAHELAARDEVVLGAVATEVETGMRLAVIGLLGWSVLRLGTSFSVLPQLRRIVRAGPYRFVRHPMYTSFLLYDLSFWVFREDASLALLWLLEFGLLGWRARREESGALMHEPDYRDYCHAVRARFVPGLL